MTTCFRSRFESLFELRLHLRRIQGTSIRHRLFFSPALLAAPGQVEASKPKGWGRVPCEQQLFCLLFSLNARGTYTMLTHSTI